MSQAGLNRTWARGLLACIYHAGARDICIAPGSRSTPLALEALLLADKSSAKPDPDKVTIHTHFDERGLGFLGLGLSKASKKPVVLIVTSGTAVANLLPAIVESGLTREQLIVLTADRPAELIGVGANQAIVQKGIYSSHVTQEILLESPSEQESLSEVFKDILSGLAKQAQYRGSLHINCPYPEPLYIQSEDELTQYQGLLGFMAPEWLTQQFNLASRSWRHAYDALYSNFGDSTAELISLFPKKGVIIIGAVSLDEAIKIKAFGENLGWPVFADPQSGVSTKFQHYDIWLQAEQYKARFEEAEVILQFGGRLVSKRLLAWIKTQVESHQTSYWLIDPSLSKLNPDGLPQHRMRVAVGECLAYLTSLYQNQHTFEHTKSFWLSKRDDFVSLMHQTFPKWTDHDHICECLFAYKLPQVLAGMQHPDLFIGNSLMVRLIDMFSALPNCEVFTNRGASGIDGLLATAIGVQRARNQAQLCLLGDTSLLYDLNSLSLATQVCQPFVILVSNNDGGAIFDMLPVPDAQKQTLYQMPHGYQFEDAAKQFKLAYTKAKSIQSIIEDISRYIDDFQAQRCRSGLLIELDAISGQAAQNIQMIVKTVQDYAR